MFSLKPLVILDVIRRFSSPVNITRDANSAGYFVTKNDQNHDPTTNVSFHMGTPYEMLFLHHVTRQRIKLFEGLCGI